MSFTLTIEERDGQRSVVVEDDGRTVYAYLLEGETIVSDVWLYNSAPVGEQRWDDPDDLPFPNKPEYVRDDDELRIHAESSVRCDWDAAGANVYVDDVMTARLSRGAKPGWSRLVRKNGPLGRRLVEVLE